jgi:hypothetical protein
MPSLEINAGFLDIHRLVTLWYNMYKISAKGRDTMPIKGTMTNKSIANRSLLKALNKKLRRNPRYINQHKGKVLVDYDYGRNQVEIQVVPSDTAIATLEEHPSKEVDPVKKKRLTVEEKLALSKKLAGSAKLFSTKGVEDAIKIANREYDQEEEE